MYAVTYKSTLNMFEDRKAAFNNMITTQMEIEKEATAYEDMLSEDEGAPDRDSVVVIKIADMVDFDDIPRDAIKLLREHFEKVKILEDQLEKEFSEICEKKNVLKTVLHKLDLTQLNDDQNPEDGSNDSDDIGLAY